ncbi:MAG: metallophosphoesterase [DPANN group archaeon]|nr:metallophosphoesterase [DPANN group archaeon]
MKILCISDFHGKFPNKLYSFAKEEKPDLVLVAGDLSESDAFRDLQFKNWNKLKSGETIETIIGKRKFKQLLQSSAESVTNIFTKLEKLDVPVIIIIGNADHTTQSLSTYGLEKSGIDHLALNFENIILVDRTFIEIDNLAIVAHGGYRGVKSRKSHKEGDSLKYATHKTQYKKDLKSLFKNMKDKTQTIFLTHDVPFNTEMDLVNLETSPMNGKHVGDDVYRASIEKYKPAINICGHMHENQGKEIIKDTIVANCGYGHDGECCIVNMKDKKTSVKFYKL